VVAAADQQSGRSGGVMGPDNGKLAFRIVTNPVGSSRQPVLPLFIGENTAKHYLPDALKELAEHGPGPARERDDQFQWFELADQVKVGEAATGECRGRKYILLATRPPYAMVPVEGGDAWALAKVYALPADGHPGNFQIGFELDDRGAEMFSTLTRANVGNALAILIDGRVVSAPVIMEAMGKNGLINGNFSEQKVNTLIRALRAGMSAGRQADSPAGTERSPVNLDAVGTDQAQPREVSIRLDPDRLARLGVTVKDVASALRKAGVTDSISADDMSKLETVVIHRADGRVIALRDVARITLETADAGEDVGGVGTAAQSTSEGVELRLPVTVIDDSEN